MFHFIFLVRNWIGRIQTDEPIRQRNNDEDHRERKNHPEICEFTSATEMNREIEQQVGAEGEKERNTPEIKIGIQVFASKVPDIIVHMNQKNFLFLESLRIGVYSMQLRNFLSKKENHILD